MKNWKIFGLITVLVLALVACGTANESETSNEPVSEEAGQTSGAGEANNSAYPMTIKSLSGDYDDSESGENIIFEDVVLDKMPERIVVLDYGFLDTLDALGVEGVVGVAYNGGKGHLPRHIKEKYAPSDTIQDVGTLKEINYEAVAAADPDIIFISGRQAPSYHELKEITPNVVFVGSDNSNYVEGLIESIDLAAQIFGKEDKAEELKAAYQEKVEEVKAKAANYENALVAMYNDKKISGFDDGPNSRFAYVYNDFGFVPATSGIQTSNHGSDFSFESILNVDPEVLLIIDRTVSDVEAVKADVENDIIQKTRAYQEGKIVYLDGVNWYFASNGITTEMEKLDEILNELQ